MDPICMDRRTFTAGMAAAGLLTVAGTGLLGNAPAALADEAEFPAPTKGQPVEAKVDPKTGELAVNDDVIVRYSTCLGCYCDCGNRVKIDRETGRVLSVGGNPYHVNSAYPCLPFEASLDDAYRAQSFANGYGNTTHGTVCARGQGTWVMYSQPDRITTPLKRAGKRGENKWTAISWDQLITEVTEGGKLFADLGEDREIEGFKAVHDNTTLIDPERPDLGTVSNQLVLMGGRSDGRYGTSGRFVKGFGTVNQVGHGATCGCAQWAKPLTEKRSVGAISDVDYCEYILWMGEFPGATGNSFQGIAKRSAKRLRDGECKMDVLDPVLGNGNVTPTMPGINWVPIKASTNPAFSCAAVQWIVDNEAYNEEYLRFPNFQAAWDAGYGSFSNATLLVVVDEADENYRKFLRPEQAGLETPVLEEGASDPDFRVCIDSATGEPVVNTTCTQADLDFDGEVNGVHVRTAWSLMLESIYEKTPEEYSEICGVSVEEINRIAKEFTSHGTKSSARLMGGSGTQNGLETAFAYRILNALVGSCEMVGGAAPTNIGAGADGNGARYNLSTSMVEGIPENKATSLSRTNIAWEDTDEYKNRVAAGEENPQPKLPYYATSGNADNQMLWSIINQYPYQCKIMLIFMKSTLTMAPGALRDSVVERLKDPDIIPLVISCDVVMGEDTQYADYIVPDTNPYESWGVLDMEGWAGYGDAVRWPVKQAESMLLDDGRNASWEAFIADVSKACGVPGFGDNALFDVDGNAYPYNEACDFYVKALANLAYDGEPVEDITEEEMHLQGLDNLPEKWKASVKEEEWPKVLKVMSRGSRFHPIEECLGDGKRNAYTGKPFECFIWGEKKATHKNPYSGEYPSGTLHYTPQSLADGTPLDEAFDAEEFPFGATTYKPRFRSISMQANNPVLRDICATNYIEMNADDAAELGISDGEQVRVTNPTGDVMLGAAMVRAGVARGNIAVATGYGHTAWGAQDMDVDGTVTPGDAGAAAGIHLEVMLDPTVGDDVIYALSDNDAGTPARTGNMYKIEKA